MLNYESLFADAARLPIGERIRLIDDLWDTLPSESLPPLSDEWIAEIRQRSAEYDAGSTETVAWENIKAEALRRAGLTVRDATD